MLDVSTFDVAAFVQGWPEPARPDDDPWFPFLPPTQAPEEKSVRQDLRDYVADAYMIRPHERPIYRRYIAGKLTPDEKYELDRFNGWVDDSKENDEVGLGIAYAEAEILGLGKRMDMPTRLLNYRVMTDGRYATRSYRTDVKRFARLHGNDDMLLFIELQQKYEAVFTPIVVRQREEELKATRSWIEENRLSMEDGKE